MIAERLAIQPGWPWTHAAAEAFIARYDAEISEAMARLEEVFTRAHPQGSLFVYRYTAEVICRYSCTRRGTGGLQMGYVEVRMPTGECYSGTVSVRWVDGAVITIENPAVPA
jgi:hypothetical protein